MSGIFYDMIVGSYFTILMISLFVPRVSWMKYIPSVGKWTLISC